MLMDLLTTKTQAEQDAYETVSAASARFRELVAVATDRVRFYDAHLEHVRVCGKSVGCEACVMPRDAGFSRLFGELVAEVELCGEHLRRDLAAWLENVGHIDHIGDKMVLASMHVTRLTEKFHAAVEQLEDERLAVQNMLVDSAQQSHLRTAYEVCDQITRDAVSIATVFARAGEGHLHGATMSALNLPPRVLTGTTHQPHCDTVHVMMRAMVAERFRRLALELDTYIRETTRMATMRRAGIVDAMFLTLSL